MAPSRGVKRIADGSVKLHHGNVAVRESHLDGLKRSPKEVQFPDDSKPDTALRKVEPRKTNLHQRSNALLPGRKQLPIWKHADDIRNKLRADDVLLLVGETGSGKSTQVPQFLFDERWCQRKKLKNGSTIGGCIIITEPRRVAAISLARRVSEEMGTPLGTASPNSQVGYSVRFDNNTGPSTKIKYLTDGMLLQEILRDPWLKDYSAVIVDEVHERGLNVDLVLGFLKKMQHQSHTDDERGGNKIKVVVMSATADMEKIQHYFKGEKSTQNGDFKDDPEKEWNGFSDDDSPSSNSKRMTEQSRVANLLIKGRQHPVTIQYSPTSIADILEEALKRVIDIHTHAPLPGDILVFLTGQETVESLLSLIEAYAKSIQKDPKLVASLPNLLTLTLYAALPAHLQQKVFQETPKFTRKVILATNIAETSITVPGIRHVIDTGKYKQRLFRPSLGLDSLLTAPISRSSANQRSGRAGRDAPGHAYRLYTEKAFYSLAIDTEPEILRCDLSQLVLILKSHGINDLAGFPLLTPPPRRALERAVIHLLQLSAISSTTGVITSLGREMSLLPLPSHLARIFLAASLPQYDCVDLIIDIVAGLSVENIYLNIHHGRGAVSTQEADGADDDGDEGASDPRLQLRSRFHRREGDHLTLLATIQAYVSENTDRKRWCEERGISHRAMQAVMDARKQLIGIQAKKSGKQISHKNSNEQPDENGQRVIKQSANRTHNGSSSDLSTRILKTLLTGLHPNVARLASSSSKADKNASSVAQYLTLTTHQPISIHPSSVLFAATHSSSNGMRIGPRPEAIMSSEYVYTSKPYARCVSAVQLDWVRDAVAENARFSELA
jgi:ATP-dependent RNA helicase DHR2